MDMISRISAPARLIIHVFLEIPTHNFDLANLLEDPEMPSLLPLDATAQRPPDSEMDKCVWALICELAPAMFHSLL